MAKYIITADLDSYYEVFEKKPTSDEIRNFVDTYGYSLEEFTVYEVSNSFKVKNTYTLVDKTQV